MSILIKEASRQLRKNQTQAESILWNQLRNRKLLGKKFLRQHPVRFELNGDRSFFVVDFYCHENDLAIEVDGGVHESQEEYDSVRDDILDSLGIRVQHFSNEDIVYRMELVLQKIKTLLQA